MTALPADPTLDEIRAYLIPLIAQNAAFDGWGPAAILAAAAQAKIDPALATLAFDSEQGGNSAVQLIDAWFAHIDAQMALLNPDDALTGMGTTARVRQLIATRLTIISKDREALRRALSVLAMPLNLPRAAQLGWRTADAIWRAAHDSSVDANYYSKRATLSAVYAATILFLINDESEDCAATLAFLDRRLADIGTIGKYKAQRSGQGENRLSLARFIGRLRYPAL